MLRFPIESGNAFGLAGVVVAVDGGGLKLTRHFALEVEAPTPQQQVIRRFIVAPGDTLELEGRRARRAIYRQTALAHLVVSDRAPIDVRAAIQDLLTYPYGCAEQTTSTAYPHVFIDEDAARAFGLKPFTREQRAQMLEKAIGRLGRDAGAQRRLQPLGQRVRIRILALGVRHGFPAGCARAGLRRARGHAEERDGLPAARTAGRHCRIARRQAGRGTKWDADSVWRDRRYAGSGRFAVLAYGGYVLARESKAPLATLRQLHESRGLAHSGLSLVQLGLALKLMGDEPRGE